MKTILQATSLLTLAAVLTACGGSTSDTATQQNRQLGSTTVVAAAQQPPAAYTDLIQRIYLGFVGRPADPQGLTFWSQIYSANDMPTTISAVSAAYSTNARVRELIDSFAQSEESLSLYSGNTAVFVNSVYRHLFNRNAEPDGRAFWGGFIDRKVVNRAQAILWLLDGAINDDARVLSMKVQAAAYFTAQLDTPQAVASYAGDSQNQTIRDLLATITPNTDSEAFKSDISVFVSELEREGGKAIRQYVGFHFLQNQGQGGMAFNAPAYNARYAYNPLVTNAGASGELSYGAVTPQTIFWKRLSEKVLTYSAPINSNVSLPGSQIVPVLTMLCQPFMAFPSRSTNVLVARGARNLVDASQLAGQTFDLHREDCKAPQSSDSLSFDADGNAKYLSRGLSLNLPAATVSAVLSGTQAIDIDQSRITLSAYSYKRADGTVAYALVELERPTVPTIIPSGALTVWSQE